MGGRPSSRPPPPVAPFGRLPPPVPWLCDEVEKTAGVPFAAIPLLPSLPHIHCLHSSLPPFPQLAQNQAYMSKATLEYQKEIMRLRAVVGRHEPAALKPRA